MALIDKLRAFNSLSIVVIFLGLVSRRFPADQAFLQTTLGFFLCHEQCIAIVPDDIKLGGCSTNLQHHFTIIGRTGEQ